MEPYACWLQQRLLNFEDCAAQQRVSPLLLVVILGRCWNGAVVAAQG
jgi:hypothetical protein